MSSELVASMTAKITEALEAEKVDIVDVFGDGRHVSIDVVSKLFEGQSSMKRQRMVYKAIWLELQDVVHAVDAMTTKTPEEAAK
jgi:stress-induced morphogen